jgi:phosphoglycerate dehydrogenase-like enzyme
LKILIVTGSNPSLGEIIEERAPDIYEASGEGDIVVVDSNEAGGDHWADAEVAYGIIDRPSFLKAKNLRWFHTAGAGVDRMMFPELIESGLVLTSEKGLVGDYLADHAFGLLLTLTRQIKWTIENAPAWGLPPANRRRMHELAGLTMGVIGLGGTGVAVAKRAKAFGMEVIATEPESVPQPPEVSAVWKPDRLHDLLRLSDVVAVCCPLTPETNGMLDAAAFAAMKPGSYLINVTRGPVTDNDAFVAAMQSGKLAGAGLDAPPFEPLPPDHPFWKMENVVITPHNGGGSPHRTPRNVDLFISNMRRYRAGLPLDGLIDKRKGY